MTQRLSRRTWVRTFVAAGAALVLALFASGLPAAETGVPAITTSSTKPEVNIGLIYNGDFVYFFGSIPDPSADVIVKLTSTHNPPLTVNRVGKVGLFWMNVKQLTVGGLPLMYKIHSTRPVAEILGPELASQLGIGYATLKDGMTTKLLRGDAQPDDRDAAFDGIVRIKTQANLYNVDERRIDVAGGALFKHYFRFPPAATEGEYVAESFVFKNGKLIGRGVDRVVIRKTGVEAALTRLASDHPVFYGAFAVLVALAMGLAVGFVFKKGGGH
ncbi:MAG: TIGR02186 family protein [Deltaproteobacteria bacterium]|nr:TIGR02186 family protein [Deltaproteobacteria bacterium]